MSQFRLIVNLTTKADPLELKEIIGDALDAIEEESEHDEDYPEISIKDFKLLKRKESKTDEKS